MCDDIKPPENLTEYLEKVITDPFNHYCLNCKQSLSTHVIMQLGVFICGSCAEYFSSQCGGHDGQNCSIKSVFGEQEWDDGEIRTIQLGGNKPVFDLLLQNNLEKMPLIINYNHPAVQQYKKEHTARVKGSTVQVLDQTKQQLLEQMEVTKQQLNEKVEKFADSFSEKQEQFVDGMQNWWNFASEQVTNSFHERFNKK